MSSLKIQRGSALLLAAAVLALTAWMLRQVPGAPALVLLLLLGALVALSVFLAMRSRRLGRERRRLCEALRRDRASGLLSRHALEQDLANGSIAAYAEATAAEALLVILQYRFLERQLAFLREQDIAAALAAARTVFVPGEGPWAGASPLYRFSETRLALVLCPGRGAERDQEALLAELHALVLEVTREAHSHALQPEDIVVTGLRFLPDEAGPDLLERQGFAEVFPLDDPRGRRLVEGEEARRLRTDSALRRAIGALGAGDIELFVQPILLLANPGQIGLEVLARFRPTPLRGISTGHVFQLAREMGIAVRLDEFVLSLVPELQRTLQADPRIAARVEYLSINISADSVASQERLQNLITLLRQHRIDQRGFALEITETAATGQLDGPPPITTASERIHRELALRVFIDDFGSGFSNYRRIAEAWYDAIKIDRELVQGLNGSFRLQRYLGAFIGSVHALGKLVLMEGVEEYRDLVAAIRLGADALQGYLIARPMPAEALPAFLETSPWADAEGVGRLIGSLRCSESLAERRGSPDPRLAAPLERTILQNWAGLRSFEEFVLLFVDELRSWGLDTLRLSLAFLPDQDEVDCCQYIWHASRPGEVETLRMERDFLEQPEHLASPLHHLATRGGMLRQCLDGPVPPTFPFLKTLRQRGGTDYLGIRLESRGISIPVLTIALQGESRFSDAQVQRIESMSSLLSLLFHSFESERSKRLALLDPLTQLANRRSFDSFLKANVAASRLGERDLALLLIDIDRFKQVNDSYGHSHGDHCLRQLAAILAKQLRQERDFVARLGGEEFAILLLDNDALRARSIAERLRAAVANVPISHARFGITHPLTISVGVAVWEATTPGVCDADDLQQLADDCLYEAKHTGRNRVVCRRLGIDTPPARRQDLFEDPLSRTADVAL